MTASQYVGLGIVAGYFLVLIATRWMFIARSNRRFTLARIDEAQYFLEPGGEPSLLDEARAIVTNTDVYDVPPWLVERRGEELPDEPVEQALKRLVRAATYPLMWNGSRDLVAWNLLHRVEAAHAAKQTGPELVAALMKAQSSLDDLPPAKRIYWARVVHDLLEGCPNGRLRDERVAQAILHQLLSELYNARDTKFTNLATQQNKVTWLVFCGLAIMAALVSMGFEVLLLAGAVGGILSRLQREMQRRDVPSDYGLSWSVMFLSPVSGALSAWAGLLLLQSLQKFNVIDLAALLPEGTDLTEPTGAILGVALVFGISERILDRLVRQAEDEIATDPRSQRKGADVVPAQEPPSRPAPAAPAQ